MPLGDFQLLSKANPTRLLASPAEPLTTLTYFLEQGSSISMPPVLDPKASKVDGLAFLGLSLARKKNHDDDTLLLGHPDSPTHQTAFDLNEVIDREYQYVFSTNDDGWLVGGGEPPASYKLAAADTAHVEIMRIGTYEPRWGGIRQEDVIAALQSGRILIPEMTVLPTAVVANQDHPPELEIRFDLEPPPLDGDGGDGLPINWQLRFLHNQLFRYFTFPSRFCPGAFHSTIVRKAEFRSEMAKTEYFAQCFRVIQKWRKMGPQPLVAPGPLHSSIVRIQQNGQVAPIPVSQAVLEIQSSCNCYPLLQVVDDMLTPEPDEDVVVAVESRNPLLTSITSQMTHDAGIYLFRDRKTITHYFEPNFCPPYTAEKMKMIQQILAEKWDEPTLSWKPAVDIHMMTTTMTAPEAAPEAALEAALEAAPEAAPETAPLAPIMNVADLVIKDADAIKTNGPTANVDVASAALVEQ
jgi:hypothetical protein